MAYLKLNEKNLQNSFLYNGTEGAEQYEDIKGTIVIDLKEPYCVNPLDSDFIVIDLGYTIDGRKEDWNFIIDNVGMNINTVATQQNLSDLVMQDNDIVVITDDSYFRTVVMIKYRAEVLGKTLEYSFKSFNTSLSSFMMDVIAVKLNKYNPEEVEKRFTDAEGRITTNETNIKNLQDKDVELETKITTNETNIKDLQDKDIELEAKITTNETNIKELQDKTAGLTRTVDDATQEATSTLGDNLNIVKNSVIDGTLTVKDNTVLKDTSLDSLTVNRDINIIGNVKGQLKDADGFKYLKIKSGKINDGKLFNCTIEAKEDGSAIIKGEYTSYSPDNLASMKSIEHVVFGKPLYIKSVNYIQAVNKNKFELLTNCILDGNDIKMIFRNVSDAEVSLNGAKYSIIIDCQADLTNQMITWN